MAYTKIESVFAQGLHEFTDALQLKINNIGNAIAETFFSSMLQEQHVSSQSQS